MKFAALVRVQHHHASTVHSSKDSIGAIAELERQFLHRRSGGEKLSDSIVAFMGTLWFALGQLVFICLWVALNLGIPGVRPFDPFPFGMLTLIVTAEGVLFTLLVLISNNRMRRLADQRAHLNLQISMLSEKESTRILQLLQVVIEHAGIQAPDEDTAHLAEHTHVPTLARELEDKLK